MELCHGGIVGHLDKFLFSRWQLLYDIIVHFHSLSILYIYIESLGPCYHTFGTDVAIVENFPYIHVSLAQSRCLPPVFTLKGLGFNTSCVIIKNFLPCVQEFFYQCFSRTVPTALSEPYPTYIIYSESRATRWEMFQKMFRTHAHV